eukprot:11788554-Heterocapsa_arctica.AAC.2
MNKFNGFGGFKGFKTISWCKRFNGFKGCTGRKGFIVLKGVLNAGQEIIGAKGFKEFKGLNGFKRS